MELLDELGALWFSGRRPRSSHGYQVAKLAGGERNKRAGRKHAKNSSDVDDRNRGGGKERLRRGEEELAGQPQPPVPGGSDLGKGLKRALARPAPCVETVGPETRHWGLELFGAGGDATAAKAGR